MLSLNAGFSYTLHSGFLSLKDNSSCLWTLFFHSPQGIDQISHHKIIEDVVKCAVAASLLDSLLMSVKASSNVALSGPLITSTTDADNEIQLGYNMDAGVYICVWRVGTDVKDLGGLSACVRGPPLWSVQPPAELLRIRCLLIRRDLIFFSYFMYRCYILQTA